MLFTAEAVGLSIASLFSGDTVLAETHETQIVMDGPLRLTLQEEPVIVLEDKSQS